jgi:hypothetical protein
MKLSISKIPPEFVKAIPRGMRLVNRDENELLLVNSLYCPNGHNLLVDSVRIHNEASIKIKVRIENNNGFIFIDSFWGSHVKLFSFFPSASKDNVSVEAFCPYCDAELTEEYACTYEGCDSKKSLLLNLPGGKNRIHVCAKLGCPGHVMDINDLPLELIESVSSINFFGEGANDIFGGI